MLVVTRLDIENAFLRRELERKDTIILLSMTEAMKVVHPPVCEKTPPESRESSTVASEPDRAERRKPDPARGEAQEGSHRPWWRRWFGG